jgi:hypothetical protein
LIEKWQEKRNPNVQMIAVEAREEQPKIAVVTCGGMRTGVDAMAQGNTIHQWVKERNKASTVV